MRLWALFFGARERRLAKDKKRITPGWSGTQKGVQKRQHADLMPCDTTRNLCLQSGAASAFFSPIFPPTAVIKTDYIHENLQNILLQWIRMGKKERERESERRKWMTNKGIFFISQTARSDFSSHVSSSVAIFFALLQPHIARAAFDK